MSLDEFHGFRKELKTSNKEDVVVGYVDTVRNRLYDFVITTPEMDYPKELYPFLKRKIWTSFVLLFFCHFTVIKAE